MSQRGRPRKAAEYPVRICKVCGSDFTPNRKDQKHCKSSCALELARKKQSEKWKDYTRRLSYLGYWELKLENGTWVPEARWKFEQYHGLKLPPSVYVGFRDGDRNNMDKDNLYLKNAILDQAVRETGKLPKLVNGKPPKIDRREYHRRYQEQIEKAKSQAAEQAASGS